MSNKIITLSYYDENASSKISNLIVYKDISTISLNGSKRELTNNINVKAVKTALHNCFLWEPGERVLLPEFGSNLRLYLYEGITDLNIEIIMSEIQTCVTKWEPRVKISNIQNIKSTETTENNTIVLNIIYTIDGLSNEQFNYTYVYTKP